MPITAQQLRDLMKDAGLEAPFVDALSPALPLKDQGFESVHCPAVHLAIKEKWGYEIPLVDCPGQMSLDQLAAYLSTRVK